MTNVADLVADLHAAVADDHDWERALASISASLGGARIIMGAVRSDQFGFAMQGVGIDSDFLHSSAELLARPETNPWMVVAPHVPLRQLVTEQDVALKDGIRKTSVWENFYRPLGLVESIGGVLDRSSSSLEVAMFGMVDRLFSREERQMVNHLLPHLARAWRVRRAMVHWQQLAAGLASALDRLGRGIIITTPEGDICYANRGADQLLREGTTVSATRGRIGASGTAETRRLRSMIATASAAGRGEGPQPTTALPLHPRNSGASVLVMAEPITPPHCEVLRQHSVSGAILFFGEDRVGARLSTERLRHAYALTGAQAELASRIVAGSKLVDAARELGISENTARTHLKAVFQRVGVGRQADLVARAIADVGGLASDAGHGPAGPSIQSNRGANS